MAISLGLSNLLSNVSFALFVIYAQEVLDTSTTEFAVLSVAPAIGGVVGGWIVPRLTAASRGRPVAARQRVGDRR